MARPGRYLLAVAVSLVGAAAASGTMTVCPFAWLTGLPCPGCGLGRACLALALGDLSGAFAAHPLVFVVVPALAVGARRLDEAAALPRPPDHRQLAAVAAGLVVLLLGVWVARFGGALGGPVSVHVGRGSR